MSADPVRVANAHTVQTDRLREALDEVANYAQTLERRRDECGASVQSRITKALSAVRQKHRRKLTKDERAELAALRAKHAEAQCRLNQSTWNSLPRMPRRS